MVKIKIEINLMVDEEKALLEKIASEYGCEVADINEEIIKEFTNDNIKAKNTCNDLFMIEGAETDGWLVQFCDCEELLDSIETESEVY